MKKNIFKSVKVISLAIVILCTIICSMLPASALLDGAVDHSFYNMVPQYINGQRVGYSEANFTGNFYDPGDSRNNAIINATSRGGSTSEYTTYLRVYMYGTGQLYDKTSDSTGSHILQYVLNAHIADGVESQGMTLHSCTSKTNSQDKWEDAYSYYWKGAKFGWSENP